MPIHKTERTQPFLRFSDYIKALPTQWVFEHFLKKDPAVRQILSSSAINDRIKQFSLPGALSALYRSLDPEDQVKCALSYLMGSTGLTAARSVDLSDGLIRSFLVYALRNKRGEVRYFGFPEFEATLRPLCASKLASAAVRGKTPVPAQERPGNCANDIVMTAVLASQGVLAKKKQGGLTRNSLLKMEKLTHAASLLQEQECLAAMLVNYCTHAGIICENEAGYYLDAGRFDSWLKREVKDRSADILSFAEEFSGSWRTDLLRETVRIADDAWLSCTVFPEEARNEAIDTLRILGWAGVVGLSRVGTDTVFGEPRVGEPHDRQSASVLRSASPGRSNGAVILMPDFSALISPDAPPEILYRFGKTGDAQSLDRVYKGTINRDILNNSLSCGLEGAEILSWLDEWGAPPNVIATVREWVREFYRLYLSSGPMLVTTDEKVSRQIASFGPLKLHLEPVPSHAVFRIKRGSEEKVREFLGQMGFDHRMPDPDRSAPLPPVAGVSCTGTGGAEPPAAIDDDWEPVIHLSDKDETANALVLRGKKYGAGLKTLDLNEIMHIIDYATLTGTELVLDYAGSPLIKKGEYTVTPGSCNKGADPLLEATLKNGLKKQFHIRRISKIGVGIS
jgi:hypothetical protein